MNFAPIPQGLVIPALIAATMPGAILIFGIAVVWPGRRPHGAFRSLRLVRRGVRLEKLLLAPTVVLWAALLGVFVAVNRYDFIAAAIVLVVVWITVWACFSCEV